MSITGRTQVLNSSSEAGQTREDGTGQSTGASGIPAPRSGVIKREWKRDRTWTERERSLGRWRKETAGNRKELFWEEGGEAGSISSYLGKQYVTASRLLSTLKASERIRMHPMEQESSSSWNKEASGRMQSDALENQRGSTVQGDKEGQGLGHGQRSWEAAAELKKVQDWGVRRTGGGRAMESKGVSGKKTNKPTTKQGFSRLDKVGEGGELSRQIKIMVNR